MITGALWKRINPAIYFCRVFGLGLLNSDTALSHAADAFLLSANFATSVYGYIHITSLVSKRMSDLWDITTVVSVIRLHIRIFTPPFILVLSQFNKRTLTETLGKFDDIVPAGERAFVRSSVRYSVAWLLANIAGECLTVAAFHIRTKFAYFAIADFLLIVVYNFWMTIPIHQYLFVIKTVRLGVRYINDRIASMERWKLLRYEWKELRRLAVDLTGDLFGPVIVMYMVCKIADVIFFIFLIYYYGYKDKNELVTSFFVINVGLEIIGIFELFRQCNNCKLEVIFTKGFFFY